MSRRITSRSRPRMSPLYGHAVATTAAAAAAAGAIGPMSLAQLTELLWRVKSLRITAAVTVTLPGAMPEDPPDILTNQFDVEILRYLVGTVEWIDPVRFVNHESTIFQQHAAANPLTSWVRYVSHPEGSYYLGDSGFYLYAPLLPLRLNQDESGLYWIPNASLLAITDDAQGRCHLAHRSPFVNLPMAAAAGIVIPLASGDVPLPLFAVSNYGEATLSIDSCAVTVTEWFPYATTTGQAAWDTATGEPANGGPSA